MKFEFFAEYDLVAGLDSIGREIRRLLEREKGVSGRDQRRIQRIRKQRQQEVRRALLERVFNNYNIDIAFRHTLLSQLLAVDVICEGKNTQCKDYVKGKDGLQQWYYGGNFKEPRGNFQRFLSERSRWMAHILDFEELPNTVSPPLPDPSIFPHGTWAARITFTLKKPYISRDDKEFYILDNPVKKEWVFKVPYVAPAQWKGALRAAMRRLRGYTTWEEEADDEQMVRLFGNVKGEEQDFSRGYLHFYPTFFDKIGIEVINPHDRRTGAGRNPIYFECVPAGTVGTFTILYVPMGVRTVSENDAEEDIKAVARGIRAMLTEYGFGAKTSSGYGVAEVKEGDIVVVPEERRDEFIGGWRDSDDESV